MDLEAQDMGWQVTATTVRCDWVDDFAVIMVHPDKTAKCAFYNRYSERSEGKKRLKRCKWPDCPLVNEFRERAFTI
jgi:hypothetical protein